MRRILVTSALPYANGSIHLGHLVEYIQTDIWKRFQTMRGHECFYICGNDAHGTPIMLRAQQMGITPEELVKQIYQEHKKDFADFHIGFDNFYTTHSEENKFFAELIYQRLKDNGDIVSRTIKQAYDPEKNMFLPDRFVKGECPKCGTADQHGDNCEACGATYTPNELKNPVSVISGATPIEKESEHLFFNLKKYESLLQVWTRGGSLQPQIANKLDEWFNAGLQDWDISRDKPYFGFEIPDKPGKYFYVWLDAPIGYMASFKNFCDKNQIDFDSFWEKDSKTELYHFIGKDIVYFHSLFWPAMLSGANFRLPTTIHAHGFLTVNGQKMSKSRGTFIKARSYLNHLNPEHLRYYYAAKLNGGIDDIDLNFDDFVNRVNADLVGKVVNIASRCAGFITKKFNQTLSEKIIQPDLLKQFATAGNNIAELFEAREFSRAVREIMQLADKANQFIDAEKPWIKIKEANQSQHVHEVCSLGINLFRLLILYLKPILPETAKTSEQFLNIAPLTWQDKNTVLTSHNIMPFKALMLRADKKAIEALLEDAQEDLKPASCAPTPAPTLDTTEYDNK